MPTKKVMSFCRACSRSWRKKAAGIDVVWRNYVTVIVCINDKSWPAYISVKAWSPRHTGQHRRPTMTADIVGRHCRSSFLTKSAVNVDRRQRIANIRATFLKTLITCIFSVLLIVYFLCTSADLANKRVRNKWRSMTDEISNSFVYRIGLSNILFKKLLYLSAIGPHWRLDSMTES